MPGRNWSRLKRWCPHSTFGLRTEWVRLVITYGPTRWAQHAGLGNRQIAALLAWEKTAGLADLSGDLSPLGEMFRATWPDAMVAWQLLWVNTAFRFATAAWYAQTVGPGERWTVNDMVARLADDIRAITLRSARDAVYELVGLLEHTPVGSQLGQGRVLPSRPRTVHRSGLAEPEEVALAYAAQQLFLRETRACLRLAEPLLWPWVVFGCSLDDVFPRLASSNVGWLRLDETAMWLDIPLEALRHEVLF